MKSLFFTSWLQVFLISINTVFLSKAFYPGVAVAGFLITYVWVGNVKKVNVASRAERIVYSLGAMTGGLCGLAFSSLVYQVI
jgi:hypothetical protein